MDIKVKIPGLLPNIEDETTDNDVGISENKSRPEEATTTVTSNQVEFSEIKLQNVISYKYLYFQNSDSNTIETGVKVEIPGSLPNTEDDTTTDETATTVVTTATTTQVG